MFDGLVKVAYLQLGQDLFCFSLIVPCLFVLHACQQVFQSGITFRFHAPLIFLDQFHGAVAMIEARFQHGQFFGIMRVLF